MKTSLAVISDKLIDLAGKYSIKAPKFYQAELLYIQKRAITLMSAEVSGLGSQGLRDAECDRLMSETQEYLDYHTLKPEMDVINRLTWIYTELAKNVRASAWEGKE